MPTVDPPLPASGTAQHESPLMALLEARRTTRVRVDNRQRLRHPWGTEQKQEDDRRETNAHGLQGCRGGCRPTLALARDLITAASASSTASGWKVASTISARLTARHFQLDREVVRLRRYRATTAGWTRCLTVRLAADGTIRGVLVEDP